MHQYNFAIRLLRIVSIAVGDSLGVMRDFGGHFAA
jgi:hypothetical protein